MNKNYLENIFASNPFLERENIDISKLHVTLLSETPNTIDVAKLKEINANQEEIKVKDKVIYLYCPNGYGRTKLTNNMFEKKLSLSATTRNWKTITKLIEISK